MIFFQSLIFTPQPLYMETRRSFLKKASILSGSAGLMQALPASIAKALAINPAAGSTWLDAEHVVFLMQENRSFDHTFGTLQGVRGFNDPRAISLPNKNKVWLQSTKAGETYAPFRLDIKGTKATWMSSLPHSWSNQVDARNNGKYDQWLLSKPSGNKEYRAMPLTLGYHTRQDIPFYYSLADAFTVCDQNFCSSLTGTTPNRLYFWTGTIREKADENAIARVWNEDADYDTMVSWKTFPERLEENGVSWKVYQNELSVGVGFQGEEDSWLANFGDNPLEYFTQYQVKLSAEYIANLPKDIAALQAGIQQQEDLTRGAVTVDPPALAKLGELKKQLAIKQEEQKIYTKEKYNQLTQQQKNIHSKAFDTNRKDPDYHKLATLKYKDGDTDREVQLPKGDILHQFREDVNNGKLPTVSWIVAPENFSDHPSAAWYGAWYISEVMDILTKDPEVWKKTIFVLTYDENDGYFDHVPPFTAPHPYKKETGFCSPGIHTGVDYVANASQQSHADRARESSIGLGYRVPMVIASPWSRGGWVNSEVFDHTSSLQFLEQFLSHKLKKKIEEPNISDWRRTVCGDLTSTFRPYNGEAITKPAFVEKEEFVESIHKAQFKPVPSNFHPLTAAEIAQANTKPHTASFMPVQEKGTRNACALPYELEVEGGLNPDRKSFRISFSAGNKLFGSKAVGSPFQVYAPGRYNNELVRVWDYAVKAGGALQDSWDLANFENEQYHLRVHGPNGFFREFTGNQNDPGIIINTLPPGSAVKNKQVVGDLTLLMAFTQKQPLELVITDNAYKADPINLTLQSTGKTQVIIPSGKNHGWYDFTIRVKGNDTFSQRYAGRVETGQPSKTDPFMGRVLDR
jgi:phospholipase C